MRLNRTKSTVQKISVIFIIIMIIAPILTFCTVFTS
ncbi:MAG TPA: hypothetical protein DEO73_13750 [Pantoea sp.]|nr:hypothetical protein [Pantoea sp.]